MIIEEETQTEINAVHVVEAQNVKYKTFEMADQVDGFPWKETLLHGDESMTDLIRRDSYMTCHTELHFFIDESILSVETELWESTNEISRITWANSFVTHPYYNWYSCARISLFQVFDVTAYKKDEQNKSCGQFSTDDYIEDNGILSRAKKNMTEFLLRNFINDLVSPFLLSRIREPSPKVIFDDIDSFKTRLMNGTLPEKEFKSVYFTHLALEADVNMYNTSFDDFYTLYQSKNFVRKRFEKYYYQLFYKGLSVNDSIAGKIKRLSTENQHYFEHKCSRRSFKIK